ncbi:MAG: hypothetical protein BYD32DRAFT_165584 [Podila humilis]|nr:MAG: hypothetical protein BYD32DRAFT_165584 [Podila humilis]
MCMLSLLHKEPTFALIPSPDCSVRCPLVTKNDTSVRPSVPCPPNTDSYSHTHIGTVAHLYIILDSQTILPPSFVCSLCYCLFPRPNPQIIKCTLLRLVNFSHIFWHPVGTHLDLYGRRPKREEKKRKKSTLTVVATNERANKRRMIHTLFLCSSHTNRRSTLFDYLYTLFTLFILFTLFPSSLLANNSNSNLTFLFFVSFFRSLA